jgi:two-component system OmpR family response regulator
MPQLRDAPRRVLVVDDDASIRELVSTRLTIAGYAVQTAKDGVEALSRLGERRYDGMVLDLNMPQMDGFGVLECLGDLPHPPPPTLVLTASHNAEHVAQAVKLGARDYLSKPFDDRQLMMRVARLFRTQAPARPSAQPTVEQINQALEGDI